MQCVDCVASGRSQKRRKEASGKIYKQDFGWDLGKIDLAPNGVSPVGPESTWSHVFIIKTVNGLEEYQKG